MKKFYFTFCLLFCLTCANCIAVTYEDVYIALCYNPDNPKAKFVSMLKSMGAVQQGDIYVYTNSSIGKTFRIHWATSNAALRSALTVSGANIIVEAHSNYGLGFVFATDKEITAQTIYGVYYIDDARIFQMTPKWVAIDVKDFIKYQAYPYWWPKFRDGSSGIMPYTFSQGSPPYNYYIGYKPPGSSIYYPIQTAVRSAMQRFPDCGKAAWFSSTGAKPNPLSSSDQKYFITNSASWNNTYPKPHYRAKTIIFTKPCTLQLSELKYSRMLIDSCGSGYQYGEPFSHGVVFYSMGSVYGNNGITYLRSCLQGKTNYQIWQSLQNVQPIYDYFDFSKTPSTQLQTTQAVATQTIETIDTNEITQLQTLSVPQVMDKLQDENYVSDDTLMYEAISKTLEGKEYSAVAAALNRLKYLDPNRLNKEAGERDFYVAKKILNYFADISADKLTGLYLNKDPFMRGKIVRAAGELSDIAFVRNMLIKALDDKAIAEPDSPQTVGSPLRVCDMAYNQLVLNLDVEGVLRTIGTGLPIEDRDYHIGILKQKLQSKQN